MASDSSTGASGRDGVLRMNEADASPRTRDVADCITLLSGAGGDGSWTGDPHNEPPGPDDDANELGRYTLGRILGEGGMGSVFEARQTRPVKRDVAIKLIKLGMDTRQVVARFNAERQALALMNHPYVARVLDAGATPQGRPFFVMDLVQGQPITRFCDEHRLDLRQRLALFIKVCEAVHHAHTKGVIHRDLKPSNVLVSRAEDGTPVPKVIDFGVAKATAGPLGDMTLTAVTDDERLIGTPEYMSPEQAAGQAARVDTRSDVYALGVILYELLTGARPFDRSSTTNGTLDELRQLIRDTDPPRPSTRISTLNGQAHAIADNRALEPRTLVRTLRRDLEWIPLKAMAKEPAERYESAAQLAQDVRAWLEERPLLAAPPSPVYRLRKGLRRHRTAVLAGSAVAAVLVVGAVTSSVLAVRWRQEAQRATAAEMLIREEQQRTLEQKQAAESARADEQEVSHFLSDLLEAASPYRSRGKPMTVVEALDEAVKTINEDYADRPRVSALVKTAVGETYLRLGRVDEAEAMLREALREGEGVFNPNSPELAATRLHLAGTLDRMHRSPEAEPYARAAVNTFSGLGREYRQDALGAKQKLAQILSRTGRLPEAISLIREVVDEMTRDFGGDHEHTLLATNSLAVQVFQSGEREEALTILADAVERSRLALDQDHPTAMDLLSNYAAMLLQTGQLETGRRILEEGLALHQRVLGEEHPDTLMHMANLAMVRQQMGEVAQAEADLRRLIPLQTTVFGEAHPVTLGTQRTLAQLLVMEKREAEAEPLVRSLLETSRGALGPNDQTTRLTEVLLARVLLAQSQPEAAVAMMDAALEGLVNHFGAEHPAVLGAARSVANSLAEAGLDEDAARVRETYALAEKPNP